MKLIKIQYIVLFAIIVVSAFLINYWNAFIESVILVMFVYASFLLLLLIFFSYSFKRGILMAGMEKQTEFKKKIGLANKGVTFKEYLLFIYNNRLVKKENRQTSIDDLKEKYLVRIKIKEIFLIVILTGLYVFLIIRNVDAVALKVIFVGLGSPILLFIMDFFIIRTRYEESVFDKEQLSK